MFHNQYISESKTVFFARPEQMDRFWEHGWRHFGTTFYRYNFTIHESAICQVFALRVRLSAFQLTKKQRKIWNRCQSFRTIVQPINLRPEIHELFEMHKERFESNIPDSIYTFLSDRPHKIPCKALEIAVYDGDLLVAASFFDDGQEGISSIYGMFRPGYEKYSLGIYTMLAEISHASQQGKAFYYHGYCYDVPSFYDYKKQFAGLEYYDWGSQNWIVYQDQPFEIDNGSQTNQWDTDDLIF